MNEDWLDYVEGINLRFVPDELHEMLMEGNLARYARLKELSLEYLEANTDLPMLDDEDYEE